MDRREELLKMLDGMEESKKLVVIPLVDDVVFIEERLKQLRQLPFIKIHPTEVDKQKVTPAAKQYKELLQQYNNCVKILLHALGRDEGEEESPLRQYLKGIQSV